MLFKIFNGASRGLGENGKSRDIYAQIGVEFRDYLKHFKGAKFGVFMCLLLHSDEDGWSFPGIDLIARETSYTTSEIKETITELCNLLIAGQRVLFAMQVKERGRFKHNKYLVFPTAEEIEQYAAYERRPREKAVKQGTSPRTGFPSTGKPSTENWLLSRTSPNQNQEKHEPPIAASLFAVAVVPNATATNPDADDITHESNGLTLERAANPSNSKQSSTPVKTLRQEKVTTHTRNKTKPSAEEIKQSQLAPELLKEVHELLRDDYGVSYKASRDKIVENLSSRPDLMLRIIRQYGDEILENHRLDDHYNCAGALVRVLCDLDVSIFINRTTDTA
jgi:hypothetical protein